VVHAECSTVFSLSLYHTKYSSCQLQKPQDYHHSEYTHRTTSHCTDFQETLIWWWELFEFCETWASCNRILTVIGFSFNSSISMIIFPVWRHLYVALQRFGTCQCHISNTYGVALPAKYFMESSVLLHKTDWQIVTGLSEGLSTFVFRDRSKRKVFVYSLILKTKLWPSFWLPVTMCHSTKHKTPQYWHIQLHRCDDL